MQIKRTDNMDEINEQKLVEDVGLGRSAAHEKAKRLPVQQYKKSMQALWSMAATLESKQVM